MTSSQVSSSILRDLDRTRGWSSFWSGSFRLPCETREAEDTFLRLDGWRKGVAVVNGVNLGRYWPVVGPQVVTNKTIKKKKDNFSNSFFPGHPVRPPLGPAPTVPAERNHPL